MHTCLLDSLAPFTCIISAQRSASYGEGYSSPYNARGKLRRSFKDMDSNASVSTASQRTFTVQ